MVKFLQKMEILPSLPSRNYSGFQSSIFFLNSWKISLNEQSALCCCGNYMREKNQLTIMKSECLSKRHLSNNVFSKDKNKEVFWIIRKFSLSHENKKYQVQGKLFIKDQLTTWKEKMFMSVFLNTLPHLTTFLSFADRIWFGKPYFISKEMWKSDRKNDY